MCNFLTSGMPPPPPPPPPRPGIPYQGAFRLQNSEGAANDLGCLRIRLQNSPYFFFFKYARTGVRGRVRLIRYSYATLNQF